MSRIDTLGQLLSQEEESKIDLTPMLDVVFIMLIFFIVTATFVKELALDVNKPPDQEIVDTQSESITVIVRATNEIEVNGLKVDKRAVAAQVIRGMAENPKAKVSVLVEGKSNADTFVNVVNSLREAGIEDSISFSQLD
ncbi:MAG: biopolymer transporter ExbD [Chromatiales bacterium]|jgi:biopolymer transport protein ExbD|nr:biopolymer transporter ExbD [Chromatiales bacterium]MDP6435696.1 biopolymer transporter ExbD [Gammaproteobacteria bacterium]